MRQRFAHVGFSRTVWNMEKMMRELFVKYRQLIMYCMIGCTGATLDFVVYALLANVFVMHYQTANFLSVSFGIINNFFLNRQFNLKTKNRVLTRLFSFYVVGILGWALSALCLWLFVEKICLDALVAKLGTIFFVIVVQFSLNKCITFRK